ncbi:hypothetical protein EXU48_03015 [Occultella glacieicola]|uniref:Lipoprotein n=1 Tax=Occultella glacieicola TaxID=2518684 RepID=A0ABY2E8V2_9MICO|nr:hypothetical protein [Occultella glacieicola]TDE97200.1 hypothetical protein EXU48_03015 [Occultella glacieicola]
MAGLGVLSLASALAACTVSGADTGEETTSPAPSATTTARTWDRDVVLEALTEGHDQVSVGDLTAMTEAIDAGQPWCLPVDVLYYCVFVGWSESAGVPGFTDDAATEAATNPDGSVVSDGDAPPTQLYEQFQEVGPEEQRLLVIADLDAASAATGKVLESHYLVGLGEDLDASFYVAFPEMD